MRNRIYLFIAYFTLTLFASCEKEPVISSYTSDVFIVRNNGNDMLVKVEGNTASRIIILYIHGGPGEGSWIFDKFSEPLKEKYAVALWDQANSGNSQGNSSNLSVANTINDLDKVMQVIKHRYNDDFTFYLMGHSCGTAFAVAYLSENNKQSQFKGFINISGAHNPSIVKEYQLEELAKRADIEIAKVNNVNHWEEMKQFCSDNATISSIKQFTELSLNCGNSTELIDSVAPFSLIDATTFFGSYSFFSYLSNWSSLWRNEKFIKEIYWDTDFTDKLQNIHISTLVIWGKFDLNLSYRMAENYLDNVGSIDKEVVIMEHSGHYSFVTETDLTFNAIKNFIERTK